ncbi:NADPH:quinone reductase-like Zn-dependent oxidoreductase [Paraburkholderia sp. JPY465]
MTSLCAGDRVAWCISWGAYADFAIVPAARLARLPADIRYDIAAASIFQGSTAHYLIEDVAKLEAGMTCLVHAASGGIGQLLVQLARRQARKCSRRRVRRKRLLSRERAARIT